MLVEEFAFAVGLLQAVYNTSGNVFKDIFGVFPLFEIKNDSETLLGPGILQTFDHGALDNLHSFTFLALRPGIEKFLETAEGIEPS